MDLQIQWSQPVQSKYLAHQLQNTTYVIQNILGMGIQLPSPKLQSLNHMGMNLSQSNLNVLDLIKNEQEIVYDKKETI